MPIFFSGKKGHSETIWPLAVTKKQANEFRQPLAQLCTATKDAVLLCPQRKRGWQKLEALHQNYDGGDASFTQWFRKWDLQQVLFNRGSETVFQPIFSNLEIYLRVIRSNQITKIFFIEYLQCYNKDIYVGNLIYGFCSPTDVTKRAIEVKKETFIANILVPVFFWCNIFLHIPPKLDCKKWWQ